MSYRVGHHSTSDDSSRYRPKEEIEGWLDTNNPISRLRGFMENRGWWSEDKETALRKDRKKYVLQCLKVAEKTKKPSLTEVCYFKILIYFLNYILI